MLTESVSGRRERVMVDLSGMLNRPVRRNRRPRELAIEDHRVARGLLFTAFWDKVDTLHDEGIPTDRVTSDDARALVREVDADDVKIRRGPGGE